MAQDLNSRIEEYPQMSHEIDASPVKALENFIRMMYQVGAKEPVTLSSKFDPSGVKLAIEEATKYALTLSVKGQSDTANRMLNHFLSTLSINAGEVIRTRQADIPSMRTAINTLIENDQSFGNLRTTLNTIFPLPKGESAS